MRTRALITFAALSLATAGWVSAGTHSLSVADAMVKSAETEKPVLFKVGTEWCSVCKSFDAAVDENADFRTALGEKVILVQLDAEKGDGVEIAKQYNVTNYPTFLLTNADGAVMDRWMGFKKADYFVESVDHAVADMIPLSERLTRFASHPSAGDAAKIAKIRLSEGMAAEAAAYFQQAMNLDRRADHTWGYFTAVSTGAKHSLFTLDQVGEAADAVFARTSGGEQARLFGVLWNVRELSRKAGDDDFFVPYLQAAMDRTEGLEGKEIAKYRNWYAADYVLHVEGDVDKAVETKRASMPEDWETQPNQLNNFAWWCFENAINLDEAYEIANQGISLAEAGSQKANIYDTLAEICNLKGDCEEAVTLIQMAIAEDPNNPYFTQQASRFEEELRQQQLASK